MEFLVLQVHQEFRRKIITFSVLKIQGNDELNVKITIISRHVKEIILWKEFEKL
jgi:hypothetical protein